MDSAMEVVSVPVIIGVVYLVLFIYKSVVTSEMVHAEKWVQFIPVLAAVLGIILGVVTFYWLPEVMPADNVLMAILIGGASGLSATGINQVYKQLTKKDESANNSADTDEEKK